MRKGLWILIGILCLTGIVGAQTSPNYDLHWNVIGGGGGAGSSSGYQLQGTVGQIAGITTSTSYILSAGYWRMAVAENQPPIAAFTYSPVPPRAKQVITFNASTSSDPDGTIISFSWQFGDGNTSTGMIATNTYSTNGTYAVNLTITDDVGATNTTIRILDVKCMRGDLNCNGDVDWGDVVKCAYMSWKLIPVDSAADFSDPPDGVDWGDVVKLAYYYWGLIEEL